MNYATPKSEMLLQDETVNNSKPVTLRASTYTANSLSSPAFVAANKPYGVWLLSSEEGLFHLQNTTFSPGYNVLVVSGFGPASSYEFQFDLIHFNATIAKKKSNDAILIAFDSSNLLIFRFSAHTAAIVSVTIFLVLFLGAIIGGFIFVRMNRSQYQMIN